MSGPGRGRARHSVRSGQRRWGWHRLTDPWAATVVSSADIHSGDLVVDIGAGEGALTAALVRAGAHVVAVELHPVRSNTLRARFAADSVTVVCADATRMRWPRQPFKVVANPPYTITASLIRQLLSAHVRLLSADLVLQRRVTRHLLEHPPDGANRWSRHLTLTRGATIPRAAFRPVPRVDSAILKIRRR